jgi:WD40 repeat protein
MLKPPALPEDIYIRNLARMSGTGGFNDKGNLVCVSVRATDNPRHWLYNAHDGNPIDSLVRYSCSKDARILEDSTESGERSSVYDRSRNRVTLEGSYPIFNATGDRILTRHPHYYDGRPDREKSSNLYDDNGELVSELQGFALGFNATGDLILTSSESDDISFVYDKNGNFLFELPGSNARFNATGDLILTYSESDDISFVYDKNGNFLFELPGSNARFNATGDLILTYSESDDISFVYDKNGNFLSELPGSNARFNAKGNQLIAAFAKEDMTRIYDLSGNLSNLSENLLAEFSGIAFGDTPFSPIELGFAEAGQSYVTLSKDGYLRVWKLDNGLDDLLAKGCDLARSYLENHPEEEQGQFCLNPDRGF